MCVELLEEGIADHNAHPCPSPGAMGPPCKRVCWMPPRKGFPSRAMGLRQDDKVVLDQEVAHVSILSKVAAGGSGEESLGIPGGAQHLPLVGGAEVGSGGMRGRGCGRGGWEGRGGGGGPRETRGPETGSGRGGGKGGEGHGLWEPGPCGDVPPDRGWEVVETVVVRQGPFSVVGRLRVFGSSDQGLWSVRGIGSGRGRGGGRCQPGVSRRGR